MNMERNERQEARERSVTTLLEGQSWRAVSEGPDVPLKRAMAYRLLRAVRTHGKVALQDRRHGHPSKLRGEARAFLEACCREAPCTPSPTLQAALRERFDLQVSVSQINRFRAALGVSNLSRTSRREKKRENQGIPRHAQSGKKAQGVFCSLLLPMKRNYLPV
jgi:transposase